MRRAGSSVRLGGLLCFALLVLYAAGAQSAPMAEFVVTSSASSGPGSFREAIEDANAAPGTDSITFALDPEDTVIELDAPLPDITGPVDIDGATGEIPTTLDKGLIETSADGLVLAAGSSGSRIEHFVIRDFLSPGSAGIRVESAENIVAANDFHAVDSGVVVTGDGAAGNVIGVEEIEDEAEGVGNDIWGFTRNGVELVDAGTGNHVAGNIIGLDADNDPDGGNVGIKVDDTPGAVIGADAAPDGLATVDFDLGNIVVDSEVLAGEGGYGIELVNNGTTGTIVAGNFIGTPDGETEIGNASSGIAVAFSSHNQLGPGNTIAFNGFSLTGIHILGIEGNRIVANSIHDNMGLGIAIDEGANGDLAMSLTTVTPSTIAGTVSGTPGETYFIELFTNDSCTGAEGKTFVGSVTVPNGAFSAPVSLPAGAFVTATATHNGVPTDTSQFSNCLTATVGGGGGSLAGGRAAGSGNYDLTAEGTEDWAVWGFSQGGEQCNTEGSCSTSLAPDVRKSGGTAISSLADINAAPPIPLRGIGFVDTQPFTFAWEDGSPAPPSEGNARTGLQHNGGPPPPPLGVNRSTLGTGFSFTVPADTTPRTVKVWVSLNRAGGQFTATLSDGSAAPFSDSFDVGIADFVGAVYTLTYQAGSADQTLNVSWVENVDNCVEFRCDNVAIHAVALSGPAEEELDPPVLFGAVPNAVGSTLGVAGVWDSGIEAAATDVFDVQFFSVPTCSAAAPRTPLGDEALLDTNANGIGAFAVDGLTNVTTGTLVVATVTTEGGASGISNCVVADRNNTSWPTSLELAAADTESGNLRSSGEGRWFKVPVLPNSRIDVRLSNLPSDYDLVVFKDIQQTYDEVVAGAPAERGPNLALDDLTKQGADTPDDLFNTSQYNASSWDPTNWDPTLNANIFGPQFSPTQFSPTQFSASFTAPTQFSPTQFSPTQFSPTQFSPTQFSPTQFSPTQFSRSDWASFNPADPRAFTSAQVASLVAVSAGSGTGDERVSVNTWNNTGHFYIRVQGKNGSFDPSASFSLSVARTGNVCSGISSSILDNASDPESEAGPYETLILTDSSQWGSANLTDLNARLDSLEGQADGVVVDVNDDSAVRGLNAQADGNPGCPFAKNLVAARIKQIVQAYRDANPSLLYVVVVGGDDVIPFFRYPDPALLGSETLYVPPVGDTTSSQASLRLGYVLSDDFIASSDVVSIHGNDFPVPDIAIGRLVETPSEIVGVIDAYLGATGGVSPTSSLVTGYDFLTDSARQVAGRFNNLVGAANNEELITNQGISPGVTSDGANQPEAYYATRNWTATDLRRELLGAGGEDLIFLSGHFSANDTLAADYRTNVLTTELPGAPANLTNSIVFSAGCHTGYNLVNEHATNVTQPLDWAQAFAQKRATLISGTGYQYGDTDFIAHSERLYVALAQELGGAIGSSLLRSKQRFLEESPGLSALDEKAVLQATLFGLPMLRLNVTPATPAPEPSVVSPAPVVGGPGSELGLRSSDVSVSGPTGAPSAKTLTGLATPATWFNGSDGLSLKPMQPVLPLESLNVSAAGTALRGALFLGGSYQDTPNTTPLTAAPATELRGIHAPFQTDVFFPPHPWTSNFFGALAGSGDTQFHVTPVQHRSDSATTMTRRTFTGATPMSFRLFYSANVASFCGDRNTPAPCATGQIASTPALSLPPTITGVDTTHSGNTLTFRANVLGETIAGVQGVWVTWTNPPGSGGGAGTWQSILLQQDDDDPTLWTGTLTTSTPGAIDFMVQAVNGVGKVTLDNNHGAFYRHGSIPGPLGPGEDPPTPTTLSFTSGPPASVAFKQSFNVTVTLSSSAGCPVAGRRIDIGFSGEAGLPATTNAAGQATLTLTPSLPPGPHLVTASFAGTSACGSSDASRNIVVTKQATSLAIAFPFVTLTASTTPQPTPLPDRTVVVTLMQGSVTRLTFVGRTDPQGRVRVPNSLLTELAQGAYTVVADFDGDEGYAGAVATAGNGLNVIRRGSGSDRITGTNGSDLIIDTGGSNTVDARGGNDIILMLGNGSHSIVGGAGDDWIDGGSGSDKIDGGAGNDTISAGNGSNDVTAGTGDDVITAGTGSDKVNGGAGFDVCHADGGSNNVTGCEA